MKKKVIRPIDIPLVERTEIEDGAMFVVLRTLDELEEFWNKHRKFFSFAARSISQVDGQYYLNNYEWVFAPSKASVVKTVTRWDDIGIRCEWYNWAELEPEDHTSWFLERDIYRQNRIEKSEWSEAEEQKYQEDCQRRSPDSYRGWWRLIDLPDNCKDIDWFSPLYHDEIIDPTLSEKAVATLFQEKTFNDWQESSYMSELELYDERVLDLEIAYWRNEQRTGQDYYGSENE